MIEYVAEKISRRLPRTGFQLSRDRRFFSATVYLSFMAVWVVPNFGLANTPDGYYEVLRVVDGGLFELTDGKQVRLIGIDAPGPGEACSDESAQQLSFLIEGETVYLEKDISETDIDGRLLRYVYVNGIFVNREMVHSGYAYAAECPPDTKYALLLDDAEKYAVQNESGCLWIIGCINCAGNGSTCIVVSSFLTSTYHRPQNHPHIRILRSFRDAYLMPHRPGREFVRFYYSLAPVLAGRIAGHDTLKTLVRYSLLPMVGFCWMTLEMGPMAPLLLTVIFGSGLAHILRSRRLKRPIRTADLGFDNND